METPENRLQHAPIHRPTSGFYALAILAFMAAEFLVSWTGVAPGKATAWLLSHDLGFQARSLVPELSQLIWGSERYGHLLSITINGLVVLTLIGVAYFALSLKAVQGRIDFLPVLVVLFALAPPGGFAFFAYDFDRPATFVYVLTLAALLLLSWRGARWPAVAACGVLAGLMVLIHEAAIVTNVPVLLACLALAADQPSDEATAAEPRIAAKLLVCLAPAVLALPYVLSQEPMDELTSTSIVDLVRVRANFDVTPEAIAAPTLSLLARFSENMAWLQTPAGQIGLFTALLVLLPCLVVGWILLGFLGAWSRFSAENLLLRFGALLSLAPLGLCLVAHDYGRWAAYAATNLSLFVLFAFLTDRDVPPDLARSGLDHRAVVMIALLIQCLLGHNGSTGGPPRLEQKVLAAVAPSVEKPPISHRVVP
jgi:hypothetical protein